MSFLPVISYGTYMMSGEECYQGVYTALTKGYQAIDTAEGYNNEETVGEAVRRAAQEGIQDIQITTKLWPGRLAWGQPAKTYDKVLESGRASLKALRVKVIDVYLIHTPFAFEEGNDTGVAQWRACLELKREGVCREVGVSNFNIDHLKAIEDAGLEMPQYNQLELHPCCQQRELLAYMKERGVEAIAYSSLAPLGSWRVLENGTEQESGKARLTDERKARVMAVIDEIKESRGMTDAQVLLRWGLEKGYRILPKSLNEGRMSANLAVGKMKLESADVMNLDGLGGGSVGSEMEDVPMAWAFGDPVEAK